MDQSDDRFEQGCRHFDAGEYFEAHEVWEDLWNEAGGDRHAYLQGLIQAAVALHHAGNANWNGARKLVASSLGYLEKGRSAAKEVDVGALRNHLLDLELYIQGRVAGRDEVLPQFKLPRQGG